MRARSASALTSRSVTPGGSSGARATARDLCDRDGLLGIGDEAGGQEPGGQVGRQVVAVRASTRRPRRARRSGAPAARSARRAPRPSRPARSRYSTNPPRGSPSSHERAVALDDDAVGHLAPHARALRVEHGEQCVGALHLRRGHREPQRDGRPGRVHRAASQQRRVERRERPGQARARRAVREPARTLPLVRCQTAVPETATSAQKRTPYSRSVTGPGRGTRPWP